MQKSRESDAHGGESLALMLWNMRHSPPDVVLYCIVDGIGRHEASGSTLYTEMLSDSRSARMLLDSGVDSTMLVDTLARVHGKKVAAKVDRCLWGARFEAAALALRHVR